MKEKKSKKSAPMPAGTCPLSRYLATRSQVVPPDAHREELPQAVMHLTHGALSDLQEMLGPHVVEQLKVLKLRHEGTLTLQVLAVGVRLGCLKEAEATPPPPDKPWYAN